METPAVWWEGLGGSLVHALIGFPVEAGSRWVCRGFYGVPGMGLLLALLCSVIVVDN